MTDFNVLASDVLGSAYKVTSIGLEDYNVGIDTDTEVTVTVLDVYGDPVSGESVVVTASMGTFTELDGSSITAASTATGTTDSSGEFTLTFNCSAWGIVTFNANNTSVQARVTGYKSESVTVTADSTKISGGTKAITAIRNDNVVTVYVNFFGVNLAITSGATDNYTLGTMPTGWRPQTTVYQRTGQINDSTLSNSRISINTSGVISIMPNTTISGSNKTFRTTLTYNI